MPTAASYLTQTFDAWTLADAQACVAAAIAQTVGPDAYAANVALAEQGDHWNEGKQIPHAGDPALRQRTLERLKAEQAPTDTANEILDNAVNGLLGTEAAITFVALTPPPATETAEQTAARTAREAADTAAMLAALSAWWDAVDLWGGARTAARRARAVMRGPLRCWIPPSALAQPARAADAPADAPRPAPELPSGRAFADALAVVALSAPKPDAAHLFVHPDTRARAAIFLFRRDDAPAAELWYVDAAGDTVLRLLTSGAATADPSGVAADPLPLGGRLPIAEVTGALLLTEAMRHQQAALDFDGIAGRTAIKAAGFRARYTTNAQPSGTWTTVKPTAPPLKQSEWNGQSWYLVETPLLMGPNISVQLTGEQLEDTVTDGGVTTTKRSLATPNVVLEEPVDPDFFIKAAEFRRATMLRDAKQGHLALVAKGESSGTAYVQARAAFRQDLENARGPLDRALRDVLAFAIALADHMTADGDPLKGFLARYRVQVTARVDAGPLTPEERAQFVAEWTAGAYSLETLQAKLGIEDTGAERQALDRDPMVRLAYLERVAKTFAEIADTTSAAAAARALLEVGVDPTLVRALLPRDTDDVAPDDATDTTDGTDAADSPDAPDAADPADRAASSTRAA